MVSGVDFCNIGYTIVVIINVQAIGSSIKIAITRIAEINDLCYIGLEAINPSIDQYSISNI